MCQASVEQLNNPTNMMRVWAHELSRVFRDRLTDSKDRQWLDQALLQKLKDLLTPNNWSTEALRRQSFGDFLTPITSIEQRPSTRPTTAARPLTSSMRPPTASAKESADDEKRKPKTRPYVSVNLADEKVIKIVRDYVASYNVGSPTSLSVTLLP